MITTTFWSDGNQPRRPQRAIDMSHPLDFIGQRADKAVVEAVQGVEEYQQENGIVTSGVVKKVDHFTMTCDECGGDGYYDQIGEVVCEDCGMVISHKPAVVQTEYGEEGDAGGSRGLEKMGDKNEQIYFGREPSV